MKTFVLEPSMTTMSGVFYPTGHIFLMYPSLDTARKAARTLGDGGIGADDMSLLTPEEIMEKITGTVGNADIPLPSAGTEADTVRSFANLASDGHHGLLVHASKGSEGDKVMELLKDSGFSVAKKYGKLVIEDLE